MVFVLPDFNAWFLQIIFTGPFIATSVVGHSYDSDDAPTIQVEMPCP